MWNTYDLSLFIPCIKGLFSGVVIQYYNSNHSDFEKADSHGGLFLVSTEKCPYIKFDEFKVSVNTLEMLKEKDPQNKNVNYLINLRDSIPDIDLKETCIYRFCEALYNKLLSFKLSKDKDIEAYIKLAIWIYKVNPAFNLARQVQLDDIWSMANELSLDLVSQFMLSLIHI